MSRQRQILKAAQIDALILESLRHLPDADGFKSLTDIAGFGALRTANFGRIADRCAKLAAKGKLTHRAAGAFGDMYGAARA